MELGLGGKRPIVTGGALSMGHGLGDAFGNEGANVVISEMDGKQWAE